MEFDAPRTSFVPDTGPEEAGAALGTLELFEPPLEPPPHGSRALARLAHGPTSRATGSGRPPRRARRLLSGGAKGLFILALLWGLLFNFSEVRGSSMEPGIHDRDRILVDHLSYMFTDVDRGDIVVLRFPLDPNLDYIKRVVGLPGDEVVIRGQQVFVNGELFEEPYVAEELADPYTYMSTVVKDDHVFVLGDNRLRSSDSREFGQVDLDLLRGKVRFRLWPLGRAGLVD